MAESTLSVSRATLKLEVCDYLGLPAYASCTAGEQGRIDRIINSGLREFYAPFDHQWSFLHVVTTLTTSAEDAVRTSGSDGTISPAGTFDDAAAKVWTSYSIDPFTDSLVWTKVGGSLASGTYALTGATIAATNITGIASITTTGTGSYSIQFTDNWRYVMPDNFGQLIGNPTYQPNEGFQVIRRVGEEQIRALRQSLGTTTGYPELCAIRPRTTDGVAGQRYEMIFWPIPDDSYVMEYRYQVLVDSPTDSYPYPMGGQPHSETIVAAVLAAAERQRNDQSGVQKQHFIERLQASIAFDRDSRAAQTLGVNHVPQNDDRLTRHSAGSLTITVGGQTITYP